MRYLLYIFLLASHASWGQLTFSGNSNSFGRGTGVSTSIDYFALNTNPSNLGWQTRFYDHKFAFKAFDLGFITSTPLTTRYVFNTYTQHDLNSQTLAQVTWSYWETAPHDTTFLLEDRLEFRDILTRRSALKFSRVLVGASYVSEKYGTFALQINNEMTGSIQLSERAANLFALGKLNPYFDSLVLASGQVVANQPSSYSNDTLAQIVHAFSNDTLTVGQQLNGSYFQALRTRNYSFGWGKDFKALIPGWATYIGATFNFIEGQGYYNWETRDNEFYLQQAKRVKRVNSNTFRNAGYGASVSLAMSLVKNDRFILGASLNNLGFIRWGGKRAGGATEYNSRDEKNVFDYPFGTSKYTSYYDQWGEANLYLSSGENYEERGHFTTATAANFSLGSQWRVSRLFSLSSDVILPLNPHAVGSYRHPYVSLGAELVLKGIGFSTGVNNNFDQLNVPFGLTFGSIHSRCAFTLATNNLLHYFTDKTIKNNTFSAGLSFRFK